MVLPKNFGKYNVVGVLGAGAMGTVYDCVDPIIGRRVAIKTILKHSLDASEAQELLDRFKQEAQAAGRLNHPGVCAIYDYGETDYVAYIAMEYISGKELKKYFDESEKFDLKQIVRVMTEILDALDHAHRSKVVHRDIKPANIMVTDDGRIKVADFGVAKIESSMLTQVGTKVGTPAYMSPEQHKGLAVDGRSDLFSCGVILYQFLTGARPFAGGSSTVAQEILTRTPTPPSEINQSLTAVWDAITKKALAKRRDERYLTARDFIDALTQGLAEAPGGVGVPYQTATSAPSEALNTAARGGATGNTDKAERTNLAMESELEFWKEIKDSDIEEDFAAFVDSFPDGRFAHIAKRRLDKLRAASARSQSGEDALRSVPAVAAPAPGAPGQARFDADQDLTLVSSHSNPVVDAAGERKTTAPEARAPAAVSPASETDADATQVQSKVAEAKAEPDADATFVQKLGTDGNGSPGTDDAPDAGDADGIDFDLSEGAPAAPTAGDAEAIALDPAEDAPVASAAPTLISPLILPPVPAPVAPIYNVAPSAAPVTPPAPVTAKAITPAPSAVAAPPLPTFQAKPPAAAERTPVLPPVVPISSGAPATASAPPVAPVTEKGGSLAPPPIGATPPAATLATAQATTIDVAAPAAAAVAAAPVAPKVQVLPPEEQETEHQTRKSRVPMMAGVAVALLAAGAGWFMLGSNPSPSSKAPETATREGQPAQTQPSAEGSQRPSPAAGKPVPGPSKGSDTTITPDSKNANDATKSAADKTAADKLAKDLAAAEKVAADKLAKSIAAAEKVAADKQAKNMAAADKLAAEKAVADKLASEKVAADKLASEKAAADKLAVEKAAADKLATEKAAAAKLASEKAATATVASAGSIADRIAAASGPAELYKRAVALRNEGKASQAVPLLRQASAQGHGPSSRLLAVIFTDGSGDVRANFREVERYKALAESQGER